MPNKIIKIQQRIRYQNISNDTLHTIYLNDWNNAYSTKKTPLAMRFTEEFSTKFHFAKSEQRGFTAITSVLDENNDPLQHTRLKEHPDVIKVTLAKPLLPSEYYQIDLNYNAMVPDDTFTGYGVNRNGNFNLKYWYITPAVY
ncbi:MAG TPA: metalloprotease, partial [Aquaticitalea sp.]|nr:metalloprotease [Aquaticitalea sp.]